MGNRHYRYSYRFANSRYYWVSLNNTKLAVLIGTVYGALITIALDGLINGFSYLPVNFLAALASVGDPIIYAFVAARL
ncbi:YhfT family protein [Yersinia enterocolitica]|uniref:YhfT family protein n=1 Tax=Yersinia enterocolitica TaxID=630 RepID=UPI00349F1DD3